MKESWFSVTPEKIASHISSKIPKSVTVILDAFCGVGGNTIQFAKNHKGIKNNLKFLVIAIDIDPVKIEAAKNNAIIYNVIQNITFICGDVFTELEKLKSSIDLIFASPPWGGPNYSKISCIGIDELPISTCKLMKKFRKISTRIIFFMPRNTNIQEMIALSRDSKLEIEETWLNDRFKNYTFYFSLDF